MNYLTTKQAPKGNITMKDVVAVNMETHSVRLIAENKTARNAEAIVNMAIMRRRVAEEFFAEVPAGFYKEGDTWHGDA